MKEKLPGYVLKCFLATGFDSEEAIAYMDTNSVKTMEAFIEKRFSNDPSMHSQFSVDLDLPFEFPPGHKVRIFSFIKQVKENYNRRHSSIFKCTVKPHTPTCCDSNQGTVSNKRKNSNRNTEKGDHCKKLKTCSNSTSFSGELIQPDSMVHKHVKSAINCWIQSQRSELLRKNLSEEHYSIRPVMKGAGIVVQCQLCNTDIKLQPTANPNNVQFKISNWTRHVKSCFLLRFKVDTGQKKLAFSPFILQVDVVHHHPPKIVIYHK